MISKLTLFRDSGQWPTLGETEISPKDPKVDPEADSKEAPKGGDEAPQGEEQPEAVVPPVEEEADELLLDPEPKDLIPEAEAKKRNRAWEDFVKKEVHEISKEVPVVNITFMEPIASRHHRMRLQRHCRSCMLGHGP